MRLLAYTDGADHHCPDCAVRVFGEDENGHVPETATDSEGNPIGAIFSWDEWYNIGEGDQTLSCGTCGRELDTYTEEYLYDP